jgi:capsid protein
MPEFLLSGDMRGANYSSMRSALVSWRQRCEQLQFQMLAPQLLRPVFERVVTWAILSGRIEAPDFESNPSAWLSCDVYPPAALWVDPLKDAQAQREMVDAGFMSRRQVVASLGFDVEQVDEERAADAQREQALGLQSAQADQSDNEESEDEAS